MTTQEKIDMIFDAYPRRSHIQRSKIAIRKQLDEGGDFNHILTATNYYARWCRRTKVDPQFIPIAATFFNQERYNERPEDLHPRGKVKEVKTTL